VLAGMQTPANPNPVQIDDAEAGRLAELTSYEILDTPAEPQFDRIVALARALFDTPIAAISLVDRDRQWFKAKSGLESDETSREVSFCSHTIQDDAVFVVPDASLDPRFFNNPLVRGAPNIRFYAGAPLRGAGGHNLGAVCIISPNPRGDFSSADRKKMEILAGIVGTEMELRKHARDAQTALHEKEFALRDAHYRIKNSLDYANLLAEVQSDEMSTEQLGMLAMASWKQYSEAGGILMSSIKSLRGRMDAAEYRDLLARMPGFSI
jgi:GAF domain-containing protein